MSWSRFEIDGETEIPGSFNWDKLQPYDRATASLMLGGALRDPDLIIAPDGEPYLFRWHLIERNEAVNAYLHVQVASDPERPLHDHPWDNCTHMLAGMYHELLREHHNGPLQLHERTTDDMVLRQAEWSHRLILPPDIPYAMTLFTTGPKYRDWGFWVDGRWFSHEELIHTTEHGQSVFNHPGRHHDDN